MKTKRSFLELENGNLSLRRQTKLLSLSWSGIYYEPKGESELNLKLMNEIDKIYTEYPFMGRRTIHDELLEMGYPINYKRVERLMKLMGIMATVPGPHTSKARKEHKKYPYLLRKLKIIRPNQVWASDITYIPMEKGFLYLVVIMDWFSRYIISWTLSNSMESDFCVYALLEALKSGKPEIFNTDQGSQFSSDDFIAPLVDNEIKISMDGVGRFLDNIFVERLWRTVKYEEVYLKAYNGGKEAYSSLDKYIFFYNNRRRHTSLAKKTPSYIYNADESIWRLVNG